MNVRRKSEVNLKKVIIIVVVVLLVLGGVFAAVMVARQKVTENLASQDESNVESAEVTVGSISTTVSGSGVLSNPDSEEISLDETIQVTEIFVEEGDDIEEGDLLASVDGNSVLEAMSNVQAEIDEIDAELSDTADETIGDAIVATISGRVKKIVVQAEDDVMTAMYESGELMVLSIDGKMRTEIETDALALNDIVTVTTSDGATYEGVVESLVNGVAGITFSDEGPVVDDTVTVTLEDGTELGTGTAVVNTPIRVTGFAGTVSEVAVALEDEVEVDDTLIELTDTAYSANYETLLKEREELEEDLQELLEIYKEGGLYAHASGTITSVTEGVSTYTAAKNSDSEESSSNAFGMAFGANMTGSQSASTTEGSDTVIAYCPNDVMNIELSIDESDILSVSVGQEASITISTLSDDTYTGTLTEIATSGTSSGGVTTYAAVVELPKESGMLSGMSATVLITIDGSDEALLLPADAVQKTSSSAYVYTTYDEENDELGGMVEVTIGLSNSSYIEITEGLSEGDTVYYSMEEEESMFNFGGMQGGDFGGMQGGFGGFDGSNMPDSSNMPDMSNMPSGGGNMPSGGSPGGN